MHRLSLRALAVTSALALAAASGVARSEMSEIKVAQQYGISYLPLMIMQDSHLIAKHAKAAGIDLKVGWNKFAGGNVMNDAMLSDSLQFASGGVGPLVTLWAKTHGNIDVKAVAAINSMPLLLNTSNPNVRTIKDFTDKDRIALPAVKVSIQAITLQMAAEKAFGEGQEHKLDHLTVSLSHPDSVTALLSGRSEIDAHLGSPPFQYQELRHPGIHTVLNSFEVLGGPATFNLVWTTTKFRQENPKIYKAFFDALNEAIDLINKDKGKAADVYLKVSKDKDSRENILKMLDDPDIRFTTTPQNVMKYVDFMLKIGTIKTRPSTWKDIFFPEIHDVHGS